MVELVPADEVPDAAETRERKSRRPGTCRASRARPAAARAARPERKLPYRRSRRRTTAGRRCSSRRRRVPARSGCGTRGHPNSTPSIFDPAAIPMLLDLPNMQGRDFDAESTTVAKLSDDERTTFRARLAQVLEASGRRSLNQTTRVVLRIYLRRDATLAGDPVLIEASASRDGPAVMQAAMRALKDCQPFAFLPAGQIRRVEGARSELHAARHGGRLSGPRRPATPITTTVRTGCVHNLCALQQIACCDCGRSVIP